MSLLVSAAQKSTDVNAASQPGLATTVKHMAGMLWYEMLSELNKSGMSSDTLGTGGDDFQSMFLWNVAQNDFGKYDGGLTAAAMRQVSSTASAPAAAASVPDFPMPVMSTQGLNNITADAPAAPIALSATPAAILTTGNLVVQAKDFAKTIWPQITAAARALGVPPVAVLAQTALETGWGTAAPGNNLFGIKAVDGEASTTRPTHEMVDGMITPQTATFRNYPSIAASVSDYVGQMQSGFPGATGQTTVSGFAHALQQAGYATDTNYAAKIINISQSPLMIKVLQAVGAAPATTSNMPNTGASL